MLDNATALAISQAISHIEGRKPLGPEPLKACLTALRDALDASILARAAMSEGAAKRHAERAAMGLPTSAGRPPSQWYEVALGSLWEVRRLGLAAALELVTETLAEHDGGKPPTQGSIAVGLSKSGAWWRHLYTDSGEHDLTVRKCAAPVIAEQPSEPEIGTKVAQRKTRAKK